MHFKTNRTKVHASCVQTNVQFSANVWTLRMITMVPREQGVDCSRPAWINPRGPMVLIDVVSTNRSPDAANQRWQRPGSLATSTQSSDTTTVRCFANVRRFDRLYSRLCCILNPTLPRLRIPRSTDWRNTTFRSTLSNYICTASVKSPKT